MKTCLAIVGTLTGFARFFAFAIVALVVATQSLAESSKCDAKDVATIPEGMQWGVTFGFYGSEEYFASQAARDEIDAISRAGANWVTVVATVWQDTCQSTFQYRDFDLTPGELQVDVGERGLFWPQRTGRAEESCKFYTLYMFYTAK